MGGDRVWRILIRLNNRRLQEEEQEGGRGNNACRVTSLTIQMSAQATPEPGTTVYLPPSPSYSLHAPLVWPASAIFHFCQLQLGKQELSAKWGRML